jgi:hypothetical protein
VANPTLLTHTTTYARKTAADIQRYVARLAGVDASQFTADEDTLFWDLLNDELNEWRIVATKRFSEQTFTVTWDGVDSSVALPADFAESVTNHLWETDADGNKKGQVFLKSEADHQDGFVEGSHGADFNDLPYARIWREEASTRKRVLHIYPTPAENTVHRLDYYSYVEKITGDADVLEAPIAYHQAIQYGTAARWAELEGDDATATRMSTKRAEKLALLTAPVQQETKKRRRAMEFERDLGGYPAFTGADTPQVRGNLNS